MNDSKLALQEDGLQVTIQLYRVTSVNGKELIQTGEFLDLGFDPVIGDTSAKRAQWQIEHELRKYELALVNGGFGLTRPIDYKSFFRDTRWDVLAGQEVH